MSEPYTKVERKRTVLIKRYGETVLDMTLGEAEELRKQLDEALKDPLEGYGLPWELKTNAYWLTNSNGEINDTSKLHPLFAAFASMSESEQREFLMRGLT